MSALAQQALDTVSGRGSRESVYAGTEDTDDSDIPF
jgi:hypothetical protein